MIKINLLGDETVIDHSGKFLLAGYVASLVVFVAIFFLLYNSTISEIEEATLKRDQLQSLLNREKERTKEVRELEAKKKELNTKLLVIATLRKSKTGPVRVLDDLNIATPERGWIADIKEEAGAFKIVGYALDNETIAQFMKDLDVSKYFESVDLIETKKVDQAGVKIAAFTLLAKVNYAGELPKIEAVATTPETSADSGDKGKKEDLKKKETEELAKAEKMGKDVAEAF